MALASTGPHPWPYKYRNGSEADSYASHPEAKDPEAVVQGEFVNGAA